MAFQISEQQRVRLAKACRRYGVGRVELFGSAARHCEGMPEPADIDLLVEISSSSEGNLADRYLDFSVAMEELFGRPVDVVTGNSIRNPIFRQAVEAHRQLLYET